MADRYCPFCGELVPSTSVTCPKCYRKIPAEPVSEKSGRSRRERADTPVGEKPSRSYNKNIAIILAIVPGLFGFLGLGQIYRDYRRSGGYIVLAIGLLVFAASMLLLTNHGHGVAIGILSTLGAFPLMLIYAFLFIGALIDVLLNSVFRMTVHT